MEPLRPEFRQALKDAHPGLTDEVIDEYENMTALRFRLDARRVRESVEEIDRKRDELLRTRMPYFTQVAQALLARRKAEDRSTEPGFTIEINSGSPKETGR